MSTSPSADLSPAGAVDAAAGHGAFDVVVVGGSAGGMVAAATVLRELPRDFAAPVLLMLHLAPKSDAVSMFAHLPFEVDWVHPGVALEPRSVNVCPPRSFVELLPDGTCMVSPCERGALDKPIDRLFDSVARSFGPRAIGVVLTGMGADGAAGALELRSAGGRVLVQSVDSAEHPDMPRAAIEGGAADLVVPLRDLGQVIGEMQAGTPRPKARSEVQAIRRVFGDTGQVAETARHMEWMSSPLGAVVGWPDELRVSVRTAMGSPSATAVFWGTELTQLYNDAWSAFFDPAQRESALGAPARTMRRELRQIIGPMLDRVMARGHATDNEDHGLLVQRDGAAEEIYLTFSYSAIRDAQGAVVGVHATAWESTANVVAERRVRVLRTLATRVASATTPQQACELAADAMASDPADVPFALWYLRSEERRVGKAR